MIEWGKFWLGGNGVNEARKSKTSRSSKYWDDCMLSSKCSGQWKESN